MIFVGLYFDMTDLSVRPATDKKYKCKIGLLIIIMCREMYFHPFRSLMGSMRWICALVHPFSAYLRRLQKRANEHSRKYGERNGLIKFNHEDVKDCRMLVDWLDRFDKVSMYDIIGLRNRHRVMIFTDGATNGAKPNWNPGIGGFCNGYWYMDIVPKKFVNRYLKFLDEHKSIVYDKETDIAHFEALGVVVALNTFKGLIGPHDLIDIRCDNQICVYDFINKNSDDVLRMDCVRCAVHFASTIVDSRIEITYIKTGNNYYADALSKFDIKRFRELCIHNNHPFRSRPLTPKYPNLDIW